MDIPLRLSNLAVGLDPSIPGEHRFAPPPLIDREFTLMAHHTGQV